MNFLPPLAKHRDLVVQNGRCLAWFILDQVLLLNESRRATINSTVLFQWLDAEFGELWPRLRNDVANWKNDALFRCNGDRIGLRFRSNEAISARRRQCPKIEMRPSSVHGIGVFAKCDLQRGEYIQTEYPGIVRFTWDVDNYSDAAAKYNMTITCLPFLIYCPLDPRTLEWNVPKSPICYVNSASTKQRVQEGNVEYYTLPHEDWRIILRVTAPISKGTELLVTDYGPEYYF